MSILCAGRLRSFQMGFSLSRLWSPRWPASGVPSRPKPNDTETALVLAWSQGNSVAHAEFRGNIFEQHSGVADVDGCCRLNERLASGIHSPESDGTNGGDSSCIALACDSGHALSVRDRTSGGKMTKVISSAMAHVGASAERGPH